MIPEFLLSTLLAAGACPGAAAPAASISPAAISPAAAADAGEPDVQRATAGGEATRGERSPQPAAPLTAGRPGGTESRGVVEPGTVQAELGVLVERTSGRRTTMRATSAPGLTLRIGVAPRLEVRVGADGYRWTAHHAPGVDDHQRGSADASLAAKVLLVRDGARGLELSILPRVTVPSRDPAFSTGHADPGLLVAGGVALPAGFDLTLAGGAQAVSSPDGRWTATMGSAAVAHALWPRWSGVAEVVVGEPATGQRAWGVNTGVARALGSHAQIDVQVARGLSAAAPDWAVSTGLVVRVAGGR
jgi:hypothetical protein